MKRLALLGFIIAIGLIGNLTPYAQQTPNQAVPPSASQVEPLLKRMTARLSGKVVWEGQDLSQTNVSVYRDKKLRALYTSGLSDLKNPGTFTLRVEPGRYYLAAYVDVDGSGQFDEGDGYGVLGVKQWENTEQTYQAIDIGDNARLTNIEIFITARLHNTTEGSILVSTSQYQPSKVQQFKTELNKITSGCRGTLKLRKDTKPNGQAAPTLEKNPKLILAYTDTSWKYRAGITQVDAKTGRWELRLKPGKYYLMGIVDKNSSNRLDSGDTFGFYGVAKIGQPGSFPQPILIEPNTFTEGLEIQISAIYTTKRQTEKSKITAAVTGTVNATPQGEAVIRIEAYRTAALVVPVASTQTDADGKFRLQLPPGEYYLLTNHDADADGRYSEGDSLGGWGTNAITSHPPARLTLADGETRTIAIHLTARYEADGQLRAIPITKQNPDTLPGLKVADGTSTDEPSGSLTGKITSYFSPLREKGEMLKKRQPTDSQDGIEQKRTPNGILSLSLTPDFESPMWMPLFIEDDGSYRVDVKPGKYYIMAVLDQNGDGRSGLSDGIGIYGTHLPVRGTPAAVNVLPNETTPHVDIDILASYIDEKGTMAELKDGGRWDIARIHGHPEDIFKYTRAGKTIEEWVYWTKGLAFQFVADGAGWKLKKQDEFQTKAQGTEADTQDAENPQTAEHAKQTQPETSPITGQPVAIYYSHDGILWRITPDATLSPIGAGFYPNASENGALVYQDIDANVIIQDVVTGQGTVLLDNRHRVQEAVISPDGDYLAWTHTEHTGRKRITVQHLPSQKHFTIPSTAREISMPAWRRDGQLLAYCATGTIENRDDTGRNRNIYAFDSVTNSVEPIVVSPTDDADPAWNPSDLNTLAFSRKNGDDYRQIWIVTFSTTGQRTEQQITKMGGSRPVWIPADGRWILYENNGQLWTVDTRTPDSEAPLLNNGKVIFGYHPSTVPIEVDSK